MAPLLVAVASLVWLNRQELPGVLVWVIALFTVLLTYFMVLSIHYFFPHDLTIKHGSRVHAILLSLFIVMVAAPLAMLQTLNQTHTKELLVNQQNAERKRLLLYANVSESLRAILPKPRLETGDFHNLFNICTRAIYLSNPQAEQKSDLRLAVFYLDKTGEYLVIPQEGYDGSVGPDIQRLHFRITGQETNESETSYRQRLGIAGWCYVNNKDLRLPDVLNLPPDAPYEYKPYAATSGLMADHAMICARIPDLEHPGKLRGILAVSSLTPKLLTTNDAAILSAVATLFGRFTLPLDPPTATGNPPSIQSPPR
jgi:hypothetical protein